MRRIGILTAFCFGALVALGFWGCGAADPPIEDQGSLDVADSNPPTDATTNPPDPLELPDPDLGGMDLTVSRQLSNARQALLEQIESGAEGPGLGRQVGELAMLYHSYDLSAAAQAAYDIARSLEPESFDWLYYSGALAQRQGRYEAAKQHFERASRMSVEAPDSQLPTGAKTALAWRLGQSLGQLNEIPEAEASLKMAAFEPELCPAALFELGRISLTDGRPEQAVELFQQVLSLQSDAEQVYFPLGQALRQSGRAREAEVYLKRSAERDTSVGGRAICVDPLDAALASLTTGAAAHITRGQHARFAGDLDGAIREYRRAVEVAPSNTVAHQALAKGLLERGNASSLDVEEAAEHLKKAVQLDPESPFLANDSAIVSLRLQRTDEAIETLKRVVDEHPDFLNAWLTLARAHELRQEPEAALTALDRVISIDPGHAVARGRRARLLSILGRQSEAAGEMARLLDEYPPEDPAQRLQIARALAQLGAAERAFIHFQALAEDPEVSDSLKAEALLSLAGVTLGRGDREAAERHLRLALTYRPDFEAAQKALARLSNG